MQYARVLTSVFKILGQLRVFWKDLLSELYKHLAVRFYGLLLLKFDVILATLGSDIVTKQLFSLCHAMLS